MRINEHHGNKFTSRLLGTFLFAAVICVASDCHAQRHGGWFARGLRIQHGARHYDARRHHDQFNNNEPSPRHRYSAATRDYDWRNSNFYDATERYPKYYGGFHSSHFSNIGVPHGDIGFRGNGIFWTPW